jgi:hypothetical protein
MGFARLNPSYARYSLNPAAPDPPFAPNTLD